MTKIRYTSVKVTFDEKRGIFASGLKIGLHKNKACTNAISRGQCTGETKSLAKKLETKLDDWI